MFDNDNFPDDAVKDLIIDLCQVMRRYGYDVVSVGAMMRLMGVEDARAAEHDQEAFLLDESFDSLVELRERKRYDKALPGNFKNKTLH